MGNCNCQQHHQLMASCGTKRLYSMRTKKCVYSGHPNEWRNLSSHNFPAMQEGRSGHASCSLGDKLYVFGGCCGDAKEKKRSNADFFCYDFRSEKWAEIKQAGPVPCARASFAITEGVDRTIVLSGGTGDGGVLDDIWIYKTDRNQWSKITPTCQKSSSFYGHSMVQWRGALYLYGGCHGGSDYNSEVFRYCLETNTYEKINTCGDKPSARYKHQAVVIGDEMVVTGGGNYKPAPGKMEVFILNLRSMTWRQINTKSMSGDIPTNCAAHISSYDRNSDMIYLHGGFTSNLTRQNTFYSFNIRTLQWVEREPQRVTQPVPSKKKTAPPARAFHSSALHNGSLFIVGGADGHHRFSDLWKYEIYCQPKSLMELSAQALVNKKSETKTLNKKVSRELLKSMPSFRMIKHAVHPDKGALSLGRDSLHSRSNSSSTHSVVPAS